MKRKGRGNDWCETLVYSCPKCGPGNLCDVCHDHDEPRGECTICPRTCKCEACSPSRAPQPPADATPTRRRFEELVDAIGDLPTTALATPGLRPATPHVAGDGDEVKRAVPWPRPACSVSLPCGGCFTRGICDQLMWESGEAAGIARGRELGARDEREALTVIISDRMKHCGYRTGTCRSCMEDGAMIEIIEARRAGREGK